ncbi:cadmium-translocating P-type ATPase [Cryobacterium zongtaii]|uniref:Cadmium-translocating P-type ATPase n=1 Tax=Cryobacterium zongtaii TaxID=1259217 RepID=A0A2S3Z6A5_9MICO|nr:heavy metal translocating P-type ATPase [Cryobacterium zongtaii]POH60048.1 cadmium-translocating P-type ATPase [Cryobacterium zongtaii]
MVWLLAVARKYPFVVATLMVAVIAGVLVATPWGSFSPWLLAGFAVLMAAKSAWTMVRQLRAGTFGIDIPAVTAIVASVAVGEYWAAIVIVLMLTGGEALEDYAANRAKRDLTALLSRAPQLGHRVMADGSAEDVPIEVVVPGDHVLVRSNEVVPVDGILLSEFGAFDESSLTGESLPVERTAGQEVLSGGVNGQAAVVLKVTRTAGDSQYQQIVSLVESAAASTSPMVRLADRIALPFTAVAFVIAGVAWLVSGDAVRFAEVLVVATPCPLIIAAPVAFMAGMSRSAREGAIIKSSATLEKFHRAKAFAFDKTGTLTQGEPSLVEVLTTGSVEPNEMLRLAASAGQFSAHALAAAVIKAATERGLAFSGSTDAEESTANGVTASIAGHRVVVGKRSFISASVGEEIGRTPLDRGELAVYVAIDGASAGSLVFKDEVRANAHATVDSLRAQGIRQIVMLTGDDRPTAEHVAMELGIDQVRANCLPIDKVNFVTAITERPVVMVGDGVNDAPVLAAADVGIAMGARGSTAASESADVVILRDDISRVARALTVGRETVNVALQSIWIGIGLSVILMIIASFGVLPALIGAWLQEGVDVVSILWALRAAAGTKDSQPRTLSKPAETPSVSVS